MVTDDEFFRIVNEYSRMFTDLLELYREWVTRAQPLADAARNVVQTHGEDAESLATLDMALAVYERKRDTLAAKPGDPNGKAIRD